MPSQATTPRRVSFPGDPLRAKYIAETYFDNAVAAERERGMLGYTGEFEGKPVSVQATGMGCPWAAIVIEELVQLGVKRLLRVGTCGGLQPDLKLGDLIVAVSAIPADRRPSTSAASRTCRPPTGGSSTAPSIPRRRSASTSRVGPIVSSDVFYNPDGGQCQRWSDRGMLAVEMEAAVLFTIGALRKVPPAACSPSATSSSRASSCASPTRRCEDAVDQMTQLALRTATGH